MDFETLHALDAHFQQQHEALIAHYEKQQMTLEANKQRLFEALHVQYATTLEQRLAAFQQQKITLERNGEQAIQQIKKIFEHKNNDLLKKYNEQKQLLEKNKMDEISTLLTKQLQAKQQLVAAYVATEQAAIGTLQQIKEVVSFQQQDALLYSRLMSQLEQLRLVCEEQVNERIATYENELFIIEENYEEDKNKQQDSLDNTLQKLKDEQLDQLYTLEQQRDMFEIAHEDELAEREERLEQQCAAELEKLEQRFMEQEAEWEQAYEQAYKAFQNRAHNFVDELE